jgi:peptidyl-prolyl cis-trans isomerase SurA
LWNAAGGSTKRPKKSKYPQSIFLLGVTIVKSKFLTISSVLVFALALVSFTPSLAMAQEGEVQVVDEVIAQVNDEVITLSLLKRESRERIEALKADGKMTEQQATEEVAKHQAELIATLINEKLLLDKGKELDLASDIEAEVNRRMLQIAQEQGINSIEKLYQAMRENKLDPEDVRRTMRSEMMKQAVLQQEVDRRLYLGFSPDEVKKYYEAHLDLFRKPETVELAEIYLSTTGKDDEAVKARALELVAQIRAGADFGAVAAANSEREKNNQRTAPKDHGDVGNFEVPSLREDLVAMLKNVKVGGVTDPIKTPDGYQILRVKDRTVATNTSVFNDNSVRQAMMLEQQEKERELYLQTLRNEAFVKISEAYRASVEPLLTITTPAAAKSVDKNSSKKNKKP